MKGYSQYFWVIHFIGDLLIVNFSFLLSYYLKFETLIFSDKYKFLFIIFNLIWVLVALFLALYKLDRLRRLDRVLLNLFKAFILNALIISAILFSLKASEFSREHLYATYIFLFGLIMLWRYSAIKLIYIYRKSGFNYRRVIIVGGNEVANQLYTYFMSDDVLGIRVKGIFSDSSISFDIKNNIRIARIR